MTAEEQISYVQADAQQVAWMVRNGYSQVVVMDQQQAENLAQEHGDGTVTPLYTHPVVASDQVGGATVKRMMEAMSRLGVAPGESVEAAGADINDTILKLCRAAERAISAPAAQAGLSDDEIFKALEAAGVRWQFVGKTLRTQSLQTCGTIGADKIIAGVRAILARATAATVAEPIKTEEQTLEAGAKTEEHVGQHVGIAPELVGIQQAEPVGYELAIQRDARRFADAFEDGWVPMLGEDERRVVQLLRTLEAQSGLRASVTTEATKAIRFAGMVFKAYRNDGYPGDVDGDVLQRIALECGLIEEREVTESCGANCSCADVGEFPASCYFNTQAAKYAMEIAATPTQQPEGSDEAAQQQAEPVGDDLVKRILALYEPTTKDLATGKLGMGVVKGGPFREFANGSAQSQVAMFTGAEHFADGERDANAAFYAGIHALVPEIIQALAAQSGQRAGVADALIEHEASVFGHYNGDMGQWVFDECKLLEFARSLIDQAAAPTQQHSGADLKQKQQ